MQTNKYTTLIAILLIIILLIVIFSSCIQQEKKVEEEEKTFSIQQLIQNAASGQKITIPAGIYYENITINKPLTLIGEEKDNTILDGMGGPQVIHITTDNVYISNLTVRNSGGYKDNAGIRLNSNHSLLIRF